MEELSDLKYNILGDLTAQIDDIDNETEPQETARDDTPLNQTITQCEHELSENMSSIPAKLVQLCNEYDIIYPELCNLQYILELRAIDRVNENSELVERATESTVAKLVFSNFSRTYVSKQSEIQCLMTKILDKYKEIVDQSNEQINTYLSQFSEQQSVQQEYNEKNTNIAALWRKITNFTCENEDSEE